MSFSLASVSVIGSAIAAAFTATEDVVTEFEALKPYAVSLMDSAEQAYSASETAGKNKLESVLAALQAVASSLGLTWSTGLEDALTAFINTIKAAFNAFAAVGTAASTSTTTSAAASTGAAAPAATPAAS